MQRLSLVTTVRPLQWIAIFLQEEIREATFSANINLCISIQGLKEDTLFILAPEVVV